MSEPQKTHLQLERLILPLAESLGLELWGIEILGSGRPIVRVYVEGSEGHTDIEQCAELSRLAGLALDVEDIMPGAYSLEISSPGLERPFFSLNQLRGYAGQTIRLTLHSPEESWPGRKKFQGILTATSETGLTLLPEDQPANENLPLTTLWTNVQQAKLVHDFTRGKGQKRPSAKARS